MRSVTSKGATRASKTVKIKRRETLFLKFFIKYEIWFYVETNIKCIIINLNTKYFINAIMNYKRNVFKFITYVFI